MPVSGVISLNVTGVKVYGIFLSCISCQKQQYEQQQTDDIQELLSYLQNLLFTSNSSQSPEHGYCMETHINRNKVIKLLKQFYFPPTRCPDVCVIISHYMCKL